MEEQIIEVEFDQAISEEIIAQLPKIHSYQNIQNNIWELVKTSEDMRPNVFDFAPKQWLANPSAYLEK